jgi:lipid II:glycine glycyltransferase (peptidoglycan interpeptide bridge formation enzyme)
MRDRTILIDLSPPIEELRAGIKRNWKRNLKVAEEAALEIVEGSSDELFEAFIEMYKETVARKQFTEPNDINQFRLIQSKLPEKLKMQILLCRSGEGICAGLVWNALGEMGIELFAATSEVGLASRGSYLLRWRLVEKLKRGGFAIYDLNGINPITNPGSYKFKSELAGRNGKDVYFLGRFDSHANGVSYWCLQLGEKLRQIYRALGTYSITDRGKANSQLPGNGVEPVQ